MQRILFFTLLLVSLGAKANTITWQGAADANWNTGSNWSGGSVPGSTDEVVFNTAGASVTLDFTTGLTIGKLTISNNVTFKTATTRTLNVGSNSFSSGSNVFTVASSKSLTLQSTANSVGITITVVTGYKASISGTVNLSSGASTGQAHKLTTPDAGGITFQNGSICNTTSVSSSNPFGTGIDGGVIFTSGSLFVFKGGSTPFGTVATCTFQTGSKFSFQYVGATGPTGAGKTYADFEYNTTSNLSLTSANATCTIDNLTILQGTLNLAGLGSSTSVSTISIKKSIAVSSGATLTMGNSTGTNTGGFVLNFIGTTPSYTNAGTLTVNSVGGSGYSTTVNVNTGAALTLNSDFDLSGGSGSGSRNFNVLSGNSVSIISGKTLTIPGTFANNGTVSGAGTVKLNGSASTVSGTGSINNLTINNGSGNSTTISSGSQSITGTLLVSSGTLNTGGFLTLKSTSITNTAVVDQVGGTINGNVTVERFIPQGFRTFRDLGFGVYSNTGTIYSNWQESGTTNNGYGITITGAKALSAGVDNTTGFDYSLTGNGSIYQYTNNAWSAVTSTKGATLDPYKGYRVLVRGNRTVDLFPANTDVQPANMISSATLRTTGKLITGDVTYNIGTVSNAVAGSSTYGLTSGAGSYSLVTNPYIAPVDWESVWNSGATNLNANFWYCDPTGTSTGKSSGYTKFVSYSASGHTTSNPLGTSNVGRYLQPGQAFFVQNETAGATLVFKETYKNVSQSKTAIFGTTTPLNRIAIALYNSGENLDGAVTVFGNHPKAVGIEDAVKFSNSDENIAFTVGTTDLAINGYSSPSTTDALPIHIYQLKANTTYTLRLDASLFTGNGVNAFVKDNVSNTTKALVGDNTTLSFTTSATDAASYSSRYCVVFAPTTLPISAVIATATTNGNDIVLNWTIKGESNAVSYTVESSTDGIKFSSIASTSTTSFIDVAVSNGAHYYRIKATDKSGYSTYSAVISASISSTVATVSIYPNPVTGNSFGLKLSNITEGKYSVKVFNKLGQTMLTKSITHTNGTATEKVNLGNHLATGIYSVSVIGANGTTYQTQMNVK